MQPQLLGDAATTTLDKEIDGFLLTAPSPSSTQVADFLKLYPESRRSDAARALLARGVAPDAVTNALTWLESTGKWAAMKPTLWSIAAIASSAASAFHGYRRNQSIGWAIAWGIMGGIFPIFTPVVALAQGFGQRKGA